MKELVPNKKSKVMPFAQTVQETLDKIDMDNEHVHIPDGCIFEDGKFTCISKGSIVEIVSIKTGVRMSACDFTTPDQKLTVTCVVPCKSKFIIGLRNESAISSGMICIFDPGVSRVIKTIKLQAAPISVAVIREFGGISQETTLLTSLLSEVLRYMFGILAVGTEEGHLYLIDLRADDDGKDCSFIPLNTLLLIDSSNAGNAPKMRDKARLYGQYSCVDLTSDFISSAYFKYVNADGTIAKICNTGNCAITCLLYLPQSNSLVVGYSFGSFQIWSLKDLKIKYSSPILQGSSPVSHIAFQEPENDPRYCCFLWVGRGPLPSQTECYSPTSITLHQMLYGTKQHVEGYGVLYKQLDVVARRFEHQLTADAHHLVDSTSVGSRIISFNALGSANSTVCIIVWETPVNDANLSISCHLGIFDLNCYYEKQLPRSIRDAMYGKMDPVCPFFAFYLLTDIAEDFLPGGILDVYLDTKSIQWFRTSVAPQVEQFSWPSSASFKLTCLSEIGTVEVEMLGMQKQIIADMIRMGTDSFLDIDNLVQSCCVAGLMQNSLSARRLDEDNQLTDALLSIALEHNGMIFITSCIKKWSHGSITHAGHSLKLLYDWTWGQVIQRKKILDDLHLALFNSLVENLEGEQLNQLKTISSHMKDLAEILNELKHSNAITIDEGTQELETRSQVTSHIAMYTDILLLLVDCTLLPEKCDYIDANDDNKITYDAKMLSDYYEGHRSSSGNDDELFIDLMWREMEIPQDVKDENENDVLYPPQLIETMCRLFIHNMSNGKEKTSCPFYYWFLDICECYGQLRTKNVETKFKQFLDLSYGEEILVKSAWLLDHRLYNEASTHLLLIDVKISSLYYHHIVKLLFKQRELDLLALFLVNKQPNTSCTYEQVKFFIYVMLQIGKLLNAYTLQSSILCISQKQNLFNYFIGECIKNKQLQKLMMLPLAPEEEDMLHNYLVTSKGNEDYLLVYYLERGLFSKAADVTKQLKAVSALKLDQRNQDHLQTQCLLVEGFSQIVPDVQQKLNDNWQKSPRNLSASQTSRSPLSSLLLKSDQDGTNPPTIFNSLFKSNVYERSSKNSFLTNNTTRRRKSPLFDTEPVTPKKQKEMELEATTLDLSLQSFCDKSIFADGMNPLELLSTPISTKRNYSRISSRGMAKQPQSILKLKNTTTAPVLSPLSSNNKRIRFVDAKSTSLNSTSSMDGSFLQKQPKDDNVSTGVSFRGDASFVHEDGNVEGDKAELENSTNEITGSDNVTNLDDTGEDTVRPSLKYESILEDLNNADEPEPMTKRNSKTKRLSLEAESTISGILKYRKLCASMSNEPARVPSPPDAEDKISSETVDDVALSSPPPAEDEIISDVSHQIISDSSQRSEEETADGTAPSILDDGIEVTASNETLGVPVAGSATPLLDRLLSKPKVVEAVIDNEDDGDIFASPLESSPPRDTEPLHGEPGGTVAAKSRLDYEGSVEQVNPIEISADTSLAEVCVDDDEEGDEPVGSSSEDDDESGSESGSGDEGDYSSSDRSVVALSSSDEDEREDAPSDEGESEEVKGDVVTEEEDTPDILQAEADVHEPPSHAERDIHDSAGEYDVPCVDQYSRVKDIRKYPASDSGIGLEDDRDKVYVDREKVYDDREEVYDDREEVYDASEKVYDGEAVEMEPSDEFLCGREESAVAEQDAEAVSEQPLPQDAESAIFVDMDSALAETEDVVEKVGSIEDDIDIYADLSPGNEASDDVVIEPHAEDVELVPSEMEHATVEDSISIHKDVETDIESFPEKALDNADKGGEMVCVDAPSDLSQVSSELQERENTTQEVTSDDAMMDVSEIDDAFQSANSTVITDELTDDVPVEDHDVSPAVPPPGDEPLSLATDDDVIPTDVENASNFEAEMTGDDVVLAPPSEEPLQSTDASNVSPSKNELTPDARGTPDSEEVVCIDDDDDDDEEDDDDADTDCSDDDSDDDSDEDDDDTDDDDEEEEEEGEDGQIEDGQIEDGEVAGGQIEDGQIEVAGIEGEGVEDVDIKCCDDADEAVDTGRRELSTESEISLAEEINKAEVCVEGETSPTRNIEREVEQDEDAGEDPGRGEDSDGEMTKGIVDDEDKNKSYYRITYDDVTPTKDDEPIASDVLRATTDGASTENVIPPEAIDIDEETECVSHEEGMQKEHIDEGEDASVSKDVDPVDETTTTTCDDVEMRAVSSEEYVVATESHERRLAEDTTAQDVENYEGGDTKEEGADERVVKKVVAMDDDATGGESMESDSKLVILSDVSESPIEYDTRPEKPEKNEKPENPEKQEQVFGAPTNQPDLIEKMKKMDVKKEGGVNREMIFDEDMESAKESSGKSPVFLPTDVKEDSSGEKSPLDSSSEDTTGSVITPVRTLRRGTVYRRDRLTPRTNKFRIKANNEDVADTSSTNVSEKEKTVSDSDVQVYNKRYQSAKNIVENVNTTAKGSSKKADSSRVLPARKTRRSTRATQQQQTEKGDSSTSAVENEDQNTKHVSRSNAEDSNKVSADKSSRVIGAGKKKTREGATRYFKMDESEESSSDDIEIQADDLEVYLGLTGRRRAARTRKSVKGVSPIPEESGRSNINENVTAPARRRPGRPAKNPSKHKKEETQSSSQQNLANEEDVNNEQPRIKGVLPPQKKLRSVADDDDKKEEETDEEEEDSSSQDESHPRLTRSQNKVVRVTRSQIKMVPTQLVRKSRRSLSPVKTPVNVKSVKNVRASAKLQNFNIREPKLVIERQNVGDVEVHPGPDREEMEEKENEEDKTDSDDEGSEPVLPRTTRSQRPQRSATSNASNAVDADSKNTDTNSRKTRSNRPARTRGNMKYIEEETSSSNVENKQYKEDLTVLKKAPSKINAKNDEDKSKQTVEKKREKRERSARKPLTTVATRKARSGIIKHTLPESRDDSTSDNELLGSNRFGETPDDRLVEDITAKKMSSSEVLSSSSTLVSGGGYSASVVDETKDENTSDTEETKKRYPSRRSTIKPDVVIVVDDDDSSTTSTVPDVTTTERRTKSKNRANSTHRRTGTTTTRSLRSRKTVK